jgi:hypothetical protein
MLSYDELQKEIQHYRKTIDSAAQSLWIISNRPNTDPGIGMVAMNLGASLYNEYQDKRVLDELRQEIGYDEYQDRR